MPDFRAPRPHHWRSGADTDGRIPLVQRDASRAAEHPGSFHRIARLASNLGANRGDRWSCEVSSASPSTNTSRELHAPNPLSDPHFSVRWLLDPEYTGHPGQTCACRSSNISFFEVPLLLRKLTPRAILAQQRRHLGPEPGLRAGADACACIQPAPGQLDKGIWGRTPIDVLVRDALDRRRQRRSKEDPAAEPQGGICGGRLGPQGGVGSLRPGI